MENMKQNINKTIFVLIIFVLFPLVSFAQFDLEEMNSGNIHQVSLPDIGISSPESVAIIRTDDESAVKTKTVKEWTIMTYVNAKNDLEKHGIKDINEMEKVGSTDKINIVVEIGRMNGQEDDTRIDGDWTGTRRLYIQKDNDTSKITSPIIQDLGKTNMGDWREVIKFVKWAKAKYPAKHYMLIIWGHGTGWLKENSVKNTGKSISTDDETSNSINTSQLADILASVGKIDIYASDACLMQMASVVYEIGNSVDYIIGSEEFEYGKGYNYDEFLANLKAEPSMTPLRFSKEVVSSYVSSLSFNTQSVIDTKYIRNLPGFINDFVDAVMKADLKKEVKAARDAAQKYDNKDNKDMYDFVRLVVDSTDNAEVKNSGDLLMNFLKKNLIAYNERGALSAGSHGLAVYLPDSVFFRYTYGELKWPKDSAWDEFIEWQLE